MGQVRPHRFLAVTIALVGSGVLAGCGGDDEPSGEPAASGPSTEGCGVEAPADPVIDPGDGGDYQPEIDPADFVAGIDHPYLPFRPGASWVYESVEDGEQERVEVEVTDQRKEVMGIPVVVVRDTVTVDGELVEDTFDWFAQDRDGNVWYLGEETREYEDGKVSSTEGAWEAGVDGALPGIVMPAEPRVGQAYRQEYYECEAEDMARVEAVDETVSVAVGDYEDVVVTTDWNPLEPDVVERKSYAPGVGLVLEEKVAGGDGRVELVAFTAGE